MNTEQNKSDCYVIEEVKMYLFARWIATCYADEHLDAEMRYVDNEYFDESSAMSVLNRNNGDWYKEKLSYFNNVVYPNYIKNGVVDHTKIFLINNQKL